MFHRTSTDDPNGNIDIIERLAIDSLLWYRSNL